MGSWKAIGALLMMFAGAAVAILVVLAGGSQPEADMVLLTADVPQTLCLNPLAPEMPELLAGRRLPVLAVFAYEPADGKAGQILVTLVGTDQSRLIGFFPRGAFAAESTAEARRSFMPRLPDTPAEGFCYELTLLGSTGAAARIDLEISESPSN